MTSAAEIRQQRRDNVRALFGTLSQRAIALKLGISQKTVAWDCQSMGLKTTEAQRLEHMRGTTHAAGQLRWTPEQIEQLMHLYTIMSGRRVAEAMGLKLGQVLSKIRYIKKRQARGPLPRPRRVSIWTDAKDAVLRERWPTDTNTDALARELCVLSAQAVRRRVSELGLKKLPATRIATPTPSAARPPEPRKQRPMTAKELEAHERLRVRYTPETLPWQAYRMTGPVYVPPPDNTRWGR